MPDPSSALDPFAVERGLVEVGRGGGALMLLVEGVRDLGRLEGGMVLGGCSCSNLLLRELTGANDSSGEGGGEDGMLVGEEGS
jgi:hypothetical protein